MAEPVHERMRVVWDDITHLEVEAVDSIRLAGAFGSHIDVKYAMVLGMIPDVPLDKVASAGNAAGTEADALFPVLVRLCRLCRARDENRRGNECNEL